jgi:hypothetical protein
MALDWLRSPVLVGLARCLVLDNESRDLFREHLQNPAVRDHARDLWLLRGADTLVVNVCSNLGSTTVDDTTTFDAVIHPG